MTDTEREEQIATRKKEDNGGRAPIRVEIVSYTEYDDDFYANVTPRDPDEPFDIPREHVGAFAELVPYGTLIRVIKEYPEEANR